MKTGPAGSFTAGSQPLLDELLQSADAGRLLLWGGGAEGQGGSAVASGGRRGQPLAEELQHAVLLAAFQALTGASRDKQSGTREERGEITCPSAKLQERACLRGKRVALLDVSVSYRTTRVCPATER